MIPDPLKWRRYLVNICVVLAVFTLVHLYQTRDAVRGQAPEIKGLSLQGEPISLTMLQGKPVLVHFWATWCPICGLENKSIEAISRKHQVLSIVIDDAPPEDLLAYMEREQLSYPTLHDSSATIANQYVVSGVPASYIVDARGKIRFVEVGYTTSLGLRLRLWWAGFWA